MAEYIKFKATIKMWFMFGKDAMEKHGFTHMLVISNMLDYTDCCIYASGLEDVCKKYQEYSVGMQKVLEIYDLSLNLEDQLNELLTWHPTRVEINKMIEMKRSKRSS